MNQVPPTHARLQTIIDADRLVSTFIKITNSLITDASKIVSSNAYGLTPEQVVAALGSKFTDRQKAYKLVAEAIALLQK